MKARHRIGLGCHRHWSLLQTVIVICLSYSRCVSGDLASERMSRTTDSDTTPGVAIGTTIVAGRLPTVDRVVSYAVLDHGTDASTIGETFGGGLSPATQLVEFPGECFKGGDSLSDRRRLSV